MLKELEEVFESWDKLIDFRLFGIGLNSDVPDILKDEFKKHAVRMVQVLSDKIEQRGGMVEAWQWLERQANEIDGKE